MNWSSCVLGRSQSVIWSTGMYDVCMMHSSCDKTCQPGRIDFFKWHNKGKRQCEVACSVLEKVKEKKKSKFDLVFFFSFFQNETGSELTEFFLVCYLHIFQYGVPQNQSECPSEQSQVPQCVSDVKLQRQSLCGGSKLGCLTGTLFWAWCWERTSQCCGQLG